MTYHHYTSVVKDAVIDYYAFNFNQCLTSTDVEMMHPRDVLKIYLEWEGIMGYTWIIENILLDHSTTEE